MQEFLEELEKLLGFKAESSFPSCLQLCSSFLLLQLLRVSLAFLNLF